MKLIIGYLYPDLMNIYGDTGNIIALKKRCQWRGIEVVVKMFSIGNKMKTGSADIYFFGGGQDQQQELVARDLVKSAKGKVLKSEIERGVPLLAICGGYQLLGDYYRPHQGPTLKGVGLFPAFTVAGDKRMIGNIVVDSKFGGLVGFENHSGQTFLKENAQPLGKVVKGFGNNGEDQTEGCVYKNAIGCYMHGSLLPKNPALADWLIQKALEVKYGKVKLPKLNDQLENQAHQSAIQKFS
ncbi:MAG: glutamine amidotransferase [Candidatus Daviesbacteria bacterium]|nr:MAG: glutamine amidotransferase [Candidatus Daviesbacteria bacterium]